MKTFMDLYVAGEVEADVVENFVDAWHMSDAQKALHEYLGLRWDEWNQWLKDDDCLPALKAARLKEVAP